jgi:DNA-binding PadR family transcriptional regulator
MRSRSKHHRHDDHRRDDHHHDDHRHAGHRFARPAPEWNDLGMQGRHGERHGGRHERHGGGRAGRLFDHGELRFVLLHLIADKPRHGYELIKSIEDQAGGAYSPSPGVIYPTLTMLEELGYATLTEQGGKKLYALTEAGQAFLQENQRTVDAVIARMAAASAARAEGPAPQIIRAVENLKLALRLRLSAGKLTEEQTRAIAAALDAAATTVEQA